MCYALSQQAPVEEDKKNQNQVQYLQGDKKNQLAAQTGRKKAVKPSIQKKDPS